MHISKSRLVVGIICLVLPLTGCNTGGVINTVTDEVIDTVSEILSRVNLSNPRALFLGVGETDVELIQVTDDGSLDEIVFFNERNIEQTDVRVSSLIQINSQYSGV